MKKFGKNAFKTAIALSVLTGAMSWTNCAKVDAASISITIPPTSYESEEVFSIDGNDYLRLKYLASGSVSCQIAENLNQQIAELNKNSLTDEKVKTYTEKLENTLKEGTASRSLTDTEKASLKNGLSYWYYVLGSANSGTPVIEIVGRADKDGNAGGTSNEVDAGSNMDTMLGRYYKQKDYSHDTAATIQIDVPEQGDWGFNDLRILPTASTNIQLQPTIVHEMFHALGMNAQVDLEYDINTLKPSEENDNDDDEDTKLTFFVNGIYDYKGTPIGILASNKNSKVIAINAADQEKYKSDTNNFYVLKGTEEESRSGAYFTGTNVKDVLTVDGKQALIAWADNTTSVAAVPGIPVNGLEKENEEATTYSLDLSHFELQNSLESHQNYRNWGVPMEAELAALEDMGYELDRKALFGYSIYNSGEEGNLFTYTNNNPYYERNEAGTAYVNGTASSQKYGVGLHVYGKYVDVTQAADILADGDYSIGIRVDGANSKVTIGEGTKVTANGAEGLGVAVTYGKNHEVNIQGTVEATGTSGKALSFDFGNNIIGNDKEYRGSYINLSREVKKSGAVSYTADELPDDIKGALVQNVNISGTLQGDTAIYISENALVKNINIMEGAVLSGDIVSNWSPNLDLAQIYPGDDVSKVYTDGLVQLPSEGEDGSIQLNFGADANQKAMSDFKMTYSGKISGKDSLVMNVVGGELTYNETANAGVVNIKSGATLLGAGTYNLPKDTINNIEGVGTFNNSGTLAIGNGSEFGKVTITGNYKQTESGTLAIDFAVDGASDKLVIQEGLDGKGISYGREVSMAGNYSLKPTVGYYSSDNTITINTLELYRYKTDGSKELEQINLEKNDGDGFYVSGKYGYSVDLSDAPTLELVTLKGYNEGVYNGIFDIVLKHKDDAYTSLAQDEIELGVAKVLDAYSNNAPDGLQDVYEALDFSGSANAIRQSLHELSGENYGMGALHVQSIHHLLNGLVLSEDSVSPVGNAYAKDSASVSVHGYAKGTAQDGVVRKTSVTPFTQYTNQHSYNGHATGVLALTEKTGTDGLTVGYHAAYAHTSTRGKTNGHLKGDGLYLGAQTKYAPDKWGKASAYGLARLGVEDMRMHRSLAIGKGFSDDSDYTSWSGSLAVGTAYTTGIGQLQVKPFAGVDYSFAHQPNINESGSAALHIDGETYDSLRTLVGLKLSTAQKKLDKDSDYSAHLMASWNHELLSKAGTLTAGFKEISGTWNMDVKNHGRDSLTIGAGLTFHTKNKLDVVLMAGSDIYRKDGHSVYGKAGVEWKF
ncbi:MAG: autotransporter domain-containing protein [Phascolarctobacterium sp.]|nr:autotransporter domain-containing protein [Phascolarctobacterium sp.]